MRSPSPVYLDNNATTQVDPAVRAVMEKYFFQAYANPSSPYTFARQSSGALVRAREQAAALLGAEPDEIVFTSGGTESNNAAIHSALQLQPEKRHVVMTSVEHASVLRYGENLESRGYRVSYLGVDGDGCLDLKELRAELSDDTALVSIMMANNETGVIFPVEEAAQLAHERGVLFHCDGVQAAGKIPVNLSAAQIDYFSIGGHKMHAAKGVGALYIRRGSPYQPFLVGGEQEQGRRAGTENVPAIAGLGHAAELASQSLANLNSRVLGLRQRLERNITAVVPSVFVAGRDVRRLPNTSNMLFEGIESDALLALLDMEGICCSSGSACASGAHEPSHVLSAMGLPIRTRGALRVSMSRFTTERDVDYLVDVVASSVQSVQRSALPGSPGRA